MPKIIASRELLMRLPGGTTQSVRIEVCEPTWLIREKEAVCSVKVTGINDRSTEIHGTDLLQALTLALKFVNQLMQSEQSVGARFFWKDGKEYDLE